MEARIPVVLAGASGRTGREVGRAIYRTEDMVLVGAIARRHAGSSLERLWGEPGLSLGVVESLQSLDVPYAVLVDFTEPASSFLRLVEAIQRKWDLVVGTTGFGPEERAELAQRVTTSGVGAAVIANFALGSWVAEKMASEISRYFPDVEVIESHHQSKKDRPSGTARRMAEILGAELHRSPDHIPVHSIRLPGMVAHQTVIFGSSGQVVSLRHDVHDRTAYATGVMAAIRQIHRFHGRMVTDLGEVLDPGT